MKVILLENDEAITFLEQRITQAMKTMMEQYLPELKQVTTPSRPVNEWCDTHEALKLLGISKSKLQQLRDESHTNGLLFIKLGRTCRYHIPSIQQFIKNQIV